MNIFRKFGIMIFMAVPAIMGGGIVYHFSPSFFAVAIFEIILIFITLGFISN